MNREKKIISAVTLVVCFLIIFIYCLFPFKVGINSGGLNSNVEASVGLEGLNNGSFYVKYSVLDSATNVNNAFSAPVRLLVNAVRGFSDLFDIRILSFVYMIILLISMFYIIKYVDLKNLKANIVFAFAMVFIVFDLSYLLYLNTLYAEGMFYVLMVLISALYLKLVNSEKPQLPTTVVFFIVSIFISALKPGLSFMVIPFSVMGGYLFTKRKGLSYRCVLVALIVLNLIYPFISSCSFPDENTDKFNSVFYGALYENDTPEKTLEKLEIDEKYKSLAGLNTYESLPENIDKETFNKEFYENISREDLIKYYLLNPSEYIAKYTFVGYNAFETYPKYSGNFTSDTGKPADAKAGGFKIYNIIKEKMFPKTLWFIYGIPILLILLLIGYRKKVGSGIMVMGICQAVSTMVLFNVPMINSGLVDISRTMSIFNIAFDINILMIIGIFIFVVTQRKQEFKEKYGLSQ